MIINLPANKNVFPGVPKQRESNGTFDCIGMNTISYTQHKRENQLVSYNSFNTSKSLSYLHRYDRHWTKTNFPPPPPTRFSNKIVLIVDCCNLKVIHMNDRAARTLFDRQKFSDYFEAKLDRIVSPRYSTWAFDAASACQKALGAVIIATSDLIEIVDCKGDSLTVSAFVQKLTRPMSKRCLSLFAFERCHRFIATLILNIRTGLVIDFSHNTPSLFGKNMRNLSVNSLLYNVTLEDMIQLKPGSCMYVTGRSSSKNAFPITIVKEIKENVDNDELSSFELQVFTSISGLIIIDQNGHILDCNSTFLRIFLGHTDTTSTVINKNIKTLIPQYYDMITCNRNGSCEYSTLDGLTASISSDINDSISAARLTNSLAKDMYNSPSINSPPLKRRRQPSQSSNLPSTEYQHSPAKASTLAREVVLRQAARSSNTPISNGKTTSTPTRSESDQVLPGNGHYHCYCLHFNGSLLEAECLVSQIESERWALWICRSCQDPHTVELYLDSVPVDICLEESELQRGNPIPDIDTSYFSHYDNYVELQAGRLGPIFVAKKSKTVDERFVTKFFTKSELKPFDFCKSKHETLELREYHILSKIDHDHIIKCVDIFEDPHFYQLVVKRHGMDVVNFIALNPDMDEQLCSYMFNQLVDAVFYLHCNDIVHRNIRAENVLIDNKFYVKLIDFSYAHHVDYDDLPFVGSLDYCPPEILHGLRYKGKPGDIWSLGVTLFMLMFGFLPFKEPYTIIRSIRLLPNLTSEQMSDLFSDLFCPLPQTRITCEQLQIHPWVHQDVNIELYKWEDVVKRGDAQTHIDYQAFQCSPPVSHNSDNSEDQQSLKAYTGCSPVVDRRRRQSYSINSILNKTIDEYDLDADLNPIPHNVSNEQEDSQQVDRSITSFMRSLSDNLKKVKSFDSVENEKHHNNEHDEDTAYEEECYDGENCVDNIPVDEDISFSSFDETIKHDNDGRDIDVVAEENINSNHDSDHHNRCDENGESLASKNK
ncbi:hypothetical protein GJ496_010754 [Pomphorhynchus laevis]|nr:hypothetical protein GJ496_010754 [Pomphorhynchus laevis]